MKQLDMVEPRREDGLTGYKGEITLSADCRTLFLHDGRTVGGLPLPNTDSPGGGGGTLPGVTALAAYTGSELSVYLDFHSHEGAGGGWFNRIDGDTTTIADNGMSVRDALNRLWQRPAGTEVSPQLYGAYQDAGHDDTAAIMAADAYCGENGRQLRLYGGAKYLFRPTAEYVWKTRHILGDVSGIDEPASGIWFNPNVALREGITDVPLDAANDMMGCLVSDRNEFLIENIVVEGNLNTGPQTLGSDGYVNAALLPKYAAFAPGFAAFKAVGGGTGTLVNCRSGRIKVGLLLDSEQGHITWRNSAFGGIFGVYCRKNSGDYYQEGGGLSGGWAGLVFGNTAWAGHFGGMEYTCLRVHMGFGPYGMYQVDDSPDDLTGQIVGGLSGCLYSVSFEEVGECAVQFLPLSLTQIGLMTRAASAFAPDFDVAYRPEASLLPAAGGQQYWMKFGILSGFNTIACGFDASPYSTAANPAALYVNAISGGGFGLDGVNLDAFSTIVYAPNDGSTGMPSGVIPKFNNAYIPLFRGLDRAYKGDFQLTRAVLPVANLIAPEQMTAALGVKNNLLNTNGGNWTPFQLDMTGNTLANWKAANEFVGFTFPRNFYEELGENPLIAKLSYPAGITTFGSVTIFMPAAITTVRFATLTFWMAAKNPAAGQTPKARYSIGDSSGHSAYDTSDYLDPPTVFRKVRCVCNVDSTGVYDHFGLEASGIDPTTGGFYIAGVMLSFDDVAPYNPHSGPTLSGTPFFDAQTSVTTVGAAGGATALPATPLGYVKVNINGKLVSLPYYNP